MPSHLEEAAKLLTTAAMRRRTDDYRERAQQLREMAETETDPKLRANLSMLAAQYSQLAVGAALGENDPAEPKPAPQ